MAFCWCTLHVENIEESLEFYQETVGLKLIKHFSPGPGADIAFLGEGETQVELIKRDSEGGYPQSDQISLGFTVDSIDEKLEELKAKGIPIYRDVVQPNQTVKFFYVQDPNGINIQFVEQIGS